MEPNTQTAETPQEPIAPPSHTEGTIEAALDYRENKIKGQQEAPAPVDNAPAPSETPGDNNAAPVVESNDALVDEALEALAPETPQGEAEPPATPTPEIPADSRVTVTMPDGSTQTMTREDYEGGMLRQADYTRKTQDVAETRRGLDAREEALTSQEIEYAQGLEVVRQLLEAQAPPVPDERLRDEDPIEYHNQKDAYRDYVERNQALQMKQAEVQHSIAEKSAEARRVGLQQAVQYIRDKRPDLGSDEQMNSWLQTNQTYMKTQDFSDQEANMIDDPRAVLILDKARQWDSLQAKLAERKKAQNGQGQQVPSIRQANVLPAPAAQTSELKAAEANLTRFGDVDSAIDVLTARRG